MNKNKTTLGIHLEILERSLQEVYDAQTEILTIETLKRNLRQQLGKQFFFNIYFFEQWDQPLDILD